VSSLQRSHRHLLRSTLLSRPRLDCFTLAFAALMATTLSSCSDDTQTVAAPLRSSPVHVSLLPEKGIAAPTPPVACDATSTAAAASDADLSIDLSTEFQTLVGFGGISAVSFFGVSVLTSDQVDVAFGTGPDQIGLTMLRLPISPDPAQFGDELETAQEASKLGAVIFATPWSPPAALKTNGSTVGGQLAPENYAAYAEHLASFREFMAGQGVTLRAISVQNEPDIDSARMTPITYDGCEWTAEEIGNFLKQEGARFGETNLMAAESFNFNHDLSDPLLEDPDSDAAFQIVAGHLYGRAPADYPLARDHGKQVWMTEHYTDSGSEPDRANQWPLAYQVARELQNSMEANFNAYVWWYIRRGYGLMLDTGEVSKRGYLMSQFARFVRPGFVRVGVNVASGPSGNGIRATAYKNGPGSVVVVVNNDNAAEQTAQIDLLGSCASGFDRFTTSETKNAEQGDSVPVVDGRISVTLDAMSVTTFVSSPAQ
jgi:glucuronoarabinoxylan endo-1,4-beta-xylanase